jgi:hypothetical protein
VTLPIRLERSLFWITRHWPAVIRQFDTSPECHVLPPPHSQRFGLVLIALRLLDYFMMYEGVKPWCATQIASCSHKSKATCVAYPCTFIAPGVGKSGLCQPEITQVPPTDNIQRPLYC